TGAAGEMLERDDAGRIGRLQYQPESIGYVGRIDIGQIVGRKRPFGVDLVDGTVWRDRARGDDEVRAWAAAKRLEQSIAHVLERITLLADGAAEVRDIALGWQAIGHARAKLRNEREREIR